MQNYGEGAEPDVIETKSEKVVQVQMNYLELLILVRRHLETGRIDLAISFINAAINQLEKQDVREPKLQNEESIEGSSIEG